MTVGMRWVKDRVSMNYHREDDDTYTGRVEEVIDLRTLLSIPPDYSNPCGNLRPGWHDVLCWFWARGCPTSAPPWEPRPLELGKRDAMGGRWLVVDEASLI
eukprot:g28048.t1